MASIVLFESNRIDGLCTPFFIVDVFFDVLCARDDERLIVVKQDSLIDGDCF